MGPPAISADVGSTPLVFQNYKVECLGVMHNLRSLNVLIAEIYKRLKIWDESL